MTPATLRDAALHDKAQRLRDAFAEQLLALEEAKDPKDARCCDAAALAGFVVAAAARMDRDALADFGLHCDGAAGEPVTDDELARAFALFQNQ